MRRQVQEKMAAEAEKALSGLLSGDYPDSWDEYVGQERAKRALIVASRSAKLRGENLAHTLIASPYAGIGKTALAQLTVRQLGRRVHAVSGSMNLAQARIMFSMVEDGDVIFYDEFHKVMDGGKKNAEWLLHFLENGVLLTPFGEERVPNVTIIAATTDKGVLPEPIQQRFVLVELEQYSDEDGAKIATTLAGKIMPAAKLPVPHPRVLASIAKAASNQPRMIRRILHALRDLAIVEVIATPANGRYDLSEALDICDVTWDGLTKEARDYLYIMFSEARGEPAGEAYLRRRLGLVGKGLEMCEQLLLDKGLIAHTKRGRMLTSPGIRRAQELEQEEEATV